MTYPGYTGYPTGYPQQQNQNGVISSLPDAMPPVAQGFGAATSAANTASQMFSASSNRGAKAASGLSGIGSAAGAMAGIAAAAGAANAVPIAGQVAAAGLAVAALFTKIFAGRRRARGEEARRKEQRRQDAFSTAARQQGQFGQGNTLGAAPSQSQQGLTPLPQPTHPSFSAWDNRPAPQPMQQDQPQWQ